MYRYNILYISSIYRFVTVYIDDYCYVCVCTECPVKYLKQLALAKASLLCELAHLSSSTLKCFLVGVCLGIIMSIVRI